MKKYRTLMAALCAAILLCSISVTAHAQSSDDSAESEKSSSSDSVLNKVPAQEANLVARDLLYDKSTNKQFITVQASGGSTFYIVIDYDKPVDADGERYETYFLNMVDEADLLSATKAAGIELPHCICADKCAIGAINTACPACSANMSECCGKIHDSEPVVDSNPLTDSESEQSAGNLSIKAPLLISAAALIGGGVGWYFKVYRPKQQSTEITEDYEDESERYSSTPLCPEEDETEEET